MELGVQCSRLTMWSLQILLYNGSSLDLLNNRVSELGAGIYVEFASSDFVLSVLNTGCFIRYFSTQVGVQPSDWVRLLHVCKQVYLLLVQLIMYCLFRCLCTVCSSYDNGIITNLISCRKAMCGLSTTQPAWQGLLYMPMTWVAACGWETWISRTLSSSKFLVIWDLRSILRTILLIVAMLSIRTLLLIHHCWRLAQQ